MSLESRHCRSQMYFVCFLGFSFARHPNGQRGQGGHTSLHFSHQVERGLCLSRIKEPEKGESQCHLLAIRGIIRLTVQPLLVNSEVNAGLRIRGCLSITYWWLCSCSVRTSRYSVAGTWYTKAAGIVTIRTADPSFSFSHFLLLPASLTMPSAERIHINILLGISVS